MVRKRDPEVIWIAAGLGGGTGAGGSFVLANELKKIYNHIPIYGIGVVPSVSGMPNDKEALNLSNTVKSFELWNHSFNNILWLTINSTNSNTLRGNLWRKCSKE